MTFRRTKVNKAIFLAMGPIGFPRSDKRTLSRFDEIRSPALGEWQRRGPRLANIKSHVVPSWEGINNLVGESTDIHRGQWVGRGHIASRYIEWFASRARPNATLSHSSAVAEREPEVTDWVATVFSVEHNCTKITGGN
jgi:hypothetical protein